MLTLQIMFFCDINNNNIIINNNNMFNIHVDIDIGFMGDMTAAFVSGEQRGVALATEIPSFLGEGYAFLMMIYSNESSGEILTFKFYHSESNRVFCLSETEEFISNMVLGNVTNPFVFSFPENWLSVDIIPDNFMITSVYPNPFNPVINIEFSINEVAPIKFIFYDINGRVIDSINKGYLNSGLYQFEWKNISLPSGTYFITMTDGLDKHVKKVLLVK